MGPLFGLFQHVQGLVAGDIENDGEVPWFMAQEGHQFKDMWEEMIGRDHVDVVDPVNSDHHFCSLLQVFHRQGFPKPLAGDLVILAIDTSQWASGKEDCTGSSLPANGRFLPEMGAYKGDTELVSFCTKTRRPPVFPGSIDPTGPGAKGAVLI